MSTNALKTPIGASLGELAKRKAASATDRLGRSWPAKVSKVISSGIVEVNFEVNTSPFTVPKIQVPIVGSEYYRIPVQVGDKGFVVPASVYLGGVTGLGAGIPDLTQPGNLAALSFLWLGNTEWVTPLDPNAAEIYGVKTSGVILRSGDSKALVVIRSADISLAVGTEVDLDTPAVVATDNLSVGNGASGTFSSSSGQTVTVLGGIITDIV